MRRLTPTVCREMILASVVTTTHADVDWVTRAMGRVFPEQWERFRDVVASSERDGNLAAAYARLLQDPDPAVHEPAAKAWCEWEDTHVATYAGHQPSPRYEDPRFRLCFARLVTHYWSNAAFLDDDQLFRDADRIADIPVLMVHGRWTSVGRRRAMEAVEGPAPIRIGCDRRRGPRRRNLDVRRDRRLDRSLGN